MNAIASNTSLEFRTIQYPLVKKLNDRVTAAGVLDQIADWRRADTPRSASATTNVSDRAVLVGLLILAGEDSPMTIRCLAGLLQHRIDAEARRLVDLPSDLPADGTPAQRSARWYKLTASAFHRMTRAMDPFSQSMQQPMSNSDIAEGLRAHDSELAKTMKSRLDSFTQSFLLMTLAEQPAQFRDTDQPIDIAIDDWFIPSPSKNGFSKKTVPARALEEAAETATLTNRTVDVFAAWYPASRCTESAFG